MRLLALDTAAGACSAAVYSDGLVVERLMAMRRGHAEALVPMLLQVLADAGITFADLDALAVTIGPGAFTGVRIGLATARGLALATGVPCYGVSTLAAVAEAAAPADADARASGARLLIVVLDTQRGDLYAQAFRDGRPVAEPMLASADDLVRQYSSETVSVAGDAAPVVLAALRCAGCDARPAPGPGYPTARATAMIAVRRWHAGERPDGPPQPLYLRPPAVGAPGA